MLYCHKTVSVIYYHYVDNETQYLRLNKLSPHYGCEISHLQCFLHMIPSHVCSLYIAKCNLITPVNHMHLCDNENTKVEADIPRLGVTGNLRLIGGHLKLRQACLSGANICYCATV